MSKLYYLFDLDGTLTDPQLGITKSVAYSLAKFGIIEEELSQLNKFIGPPLHHSFMEYYGFSQEQATLAVDYYREYFAVTGIFENFVYDGIENLLQKLKKNGKILIVATSKPAVFARQILEHFHLTQYFDFVAGSEIDGTRVDKAEVIAYALEQCEIQDKEKAIMIGDREHDIIGARKQELDSIGVLYGYGDEAEHQNAGATYIVRDLSELEELLLHI